VAATRGRARWAVGALFATIGLRLCELLAGTFPALSHETRATVATLGQIVEVSLLLLTAVLFLTWLSRVVALTRSISTVPLSWTPSQAVWGFFIPLLSMYRPYQVVRDVHDRLDPDGVPEPAPRPRLDGSGGYRSVAMDQAPPPRTLPHASIGAWWGLFLAERLLNQFGVFSQVLAIGAGLLAVLVVRAVEGRLEERYRRVSHATDEELDEWGLQA